MNELISVLEESTDFSVRAAALVHIDLTSEIEDWRSARYGRQVRAAQISALQKTMTQMNGAIDYISEKGTEVEQTKAEADRILQRAETINDTSEGNVKLAESWAHGGTGEREGEDTDNAKYWSGQSQNSATASAGSAKTSESWAVGGTGTRDGEESNNSKYWSSESETQADRARDEADRAAQYSQIVAPGFYLDAETMQLYMKSGVGVNFGIFDGVLAWQITAA